MTWGETIDLAKKMTRSEGGSSYTGIAIANGLKNLRSTRTLCLIVGAMG
jgi:hypothetical protein